MKKAAQPELVVGIGASAGGLEAFKQLLAALPPDSGMTFLLVQHLDPTHKSLLGELLAPLTELAVRDADHGIALERGTVYIIRPDTALAVRGGKIELSSPKLHRGVRLPVDHLFRSLAREYGARSVGIVLSGAGADGSAGIRDIHAAGGLVIAQEPESSGQRGMPQSAIDTGVVDLVLQLSEIPAALNRFAALPFPPQPEGAADTDANDGGTEQLASLREQDFVRLTAVLEVQANFDLRVYKPATIERRVLRRMLLSGFDAIEPYLDLLRFDPAERQLLVRDLLINVTEFFRDQDAFGALREMVIEPMVTQAASGSALRVWVAGCATGEEAYSIAMEFLDAIEVHNKRLSLQIFATDVDQEALAFARAGIYPSSIADRVSEQHLQTYFKPLDHKGFQVRQPLRDVLSFAMHDLTRDPPFSRMNLVSCRNVLIYLTAAAQKHVLKVLHFALEPSGVLFLSTSESTGPQRELFATLSKSQRIYRKVGASRPISVPRSRSRPAQDAEPSPKTRSARAAAGAPGAGGDLARRAVLDAIAPPTLAVAEDGSVLFSHGELSPYVRIPEGDNPRFELGTVLRPKIATRVRAVLYKCRRERTPQFALSSPDGDTRRIRIGARPAPSLGDEAVILTFEPLPEETAVTFSESPESPEHGAVVAQLEKELQATREDLRNTVEELETSNEELRSSNEESMSMNEELQSANEELEATTEELRSLNEELTTVNAQLREKVEQVEQAHDDLNNFFSSTKIATIFLDERLCIKRFTPAARELLGVDHADTGRFVGDIARDLLQHELAGEAKNVLDHLMTTSRELRTTDGRWIARQLLPYRTENRRIEGVVVTFQDVTDLRTANEELNRNNRRLELAWEAARGGVLEHRVPIDAATYVSDQWAQVLGYGRDELPPFHQLFPWLAAQAHPDDRAQYEKTYAEVMDGRADRYAIELRFRHRSEHWIWVRKIAKVLERDELGRPRHLLHMMIDITDIKEVEQSLKESEIRFREMADGLPLIVWVRDEVGNQEMVNQTYREFFGITGEEIKGARWQKILHPDDADAYIRNFYACIAGRRPFHAEARVKHADGSWRWIEAWGRPRQSPDGSFRGFVGTSVDITERRRMEEILRDSEERFRTLADNISQLAWTCDRLGNATWYNQRWYEFTGTSWEEMKGEGWKRVQHPSHVARISAGLEAARAAGEPWEDTFPLRNKEGSYRWFLSRAIPIRNQAGDIVRWFGTNTDVTELREVEEKLMQADHQKDAFLAMLGHELRNPLAAIRSASDLLKRRTEKLPELSKSQKILERQTAHMAKLLDGLLDISRVINGKIRLEPEVLDFGAVCNEVVADVTGSVGRRELCVRADVPPEPLWVEGDRVRLAQIVSNLLSNSVKYTPNGGSVDLTLQRDNGMAVLTVRDTGVGIATELLPHLFEIFMQSPQTLDRSQGGLGLGLALVKTLTELHGGKVEASSDGPNQGAEFRITLPLSPKRLQPSGTSDSREGRAQRILLIEDNEDAADLLKEVLMLSGHHVTIFSRGKEGVDAVRQLRPDVVLCDLGLPDGMSGFDVARELRADASLQGIRLVAISGYGRPEDKSRSAEAGFDAHLTKPVDLKVIERILLDTPSPSSTSREE